MTKFISLGIKIDFAVAVDARIGIVARSEDDCRKIIRHFREEDVPHIDAVISGVPYTLSEAEMKKELQQRIYAPLHII
nr:unnamed protein product [Callosobruchus chinensis]